MCASYGALESTFVSTRSTVPDTFASAAARTFAATSPVSAASVFPSTVCRPWSTAAAGAPEEDDDAVVEEVAALAAAAPPTAAAATAAVVTSLDRMVDIGS